MTKENKEFKPKLRSYHIIFLSIILCPILMLNSKLVNEKRNQEKAMRGSTENVSKFLLGRLLELTEDKDKFTKDTDKICERGSKKLKEYYSTGDPAKYGIKEEKSTEKNRPDYVNALINMIGEGTEGGEGLKDNAMIYVKHLYPVLFFLVVTVLAIPGWIMCCSCCCCNCCCCCCCRKPSCKLPFFIITNVMYAIVVAVSLYGLSQSNSIFVGLADTECSLLRFLGEILDGETKETTPKWGGIDTISNLLKGTVEEIGKIKNEALGGLGITKTNVGDAEQTFEENLKDSCTTINGDTTNYNYGDYRLDIARDYGTYIGGENAPSINTFVGVWYNEYKTISQQTKNNMGSVETDFEKVSDDDMTSSLSDASNQFEDIKNSIESVKGEISDVIINNSETIEEYGKLGFKTVFSVLTIIDVAIAALMFLFCFFSGKACSKCCFFRCGLKVFLHLLWNIMAFLMILTFLFGTLFTIIGTLGKDLTSAVSFIVGEENLGKGDQAILLGEAAEKLNICINKNGDITSEINLENDNLDSFDKLKTMEDEIAVLEQKTNSLKSQKIAYNNYTRILNERASYSDINYNLIDNSGNKINLRSKVDELNSQTQSIKEQWVFREDNIESCSEYSSHDGNLYFNPYKCIPNDRYTSSCTDACDPFRTISNDVSGIVKAQNHANGDSTTSIRKVINDLAGNYDTFLDVQIDGLSSFKTTIHRLTGLFDQFVGKKDGFFSFLNCKFIGTNIKVLLKTLENSLGNNFYTVGVCLILCGFSMAIGIAFTILLIVIINLSVGKNN